MKGEKGCARWSQQKRKPRNLKYEKIDVNRGKVDENAISKEERMKLLQGKSGMNEASISGADRSRATASSSVSHWNYMGFEFRSNAILPFEMSETDDGEQKFQILCPKT